MKSYSEKHVLYIYNRCGNLKHIEPKVDNMHNIGDVESYIDVSICHCNSRTMASIEWHHRRPEERSLFLLLNGTADEVCWVGSSKDVG